MEPQHNTEVPGRDAEDRSVANHAVDRADTSSEAAPLVEEQLLVEDVSIDGMCGVY
jgi:mycofactocin precursor